MKLKAILILCLGLLLIIGGTIEYVSMNSLISILAGWGVGLSLASGAFLLFRGKISGQWIGVGSMLTLLGMFVYGDITRPEADQTLDYAVCAIGLAILLLIRNKKPIHDSIAASPADERGR